MSWTLRDTLLRCGPWEILPDESAPDRGCCPPLGAPHLPGRERDYIARTWLPPEPVEPEPIQLFPDRVDGVAR